MNAPRRLVLYAALVGLTACVDPDARSLGTAPSLHRDHDEDRQPTVVVDPSGRHGRPTTIQAGIDLAPAGGRVRVLPGTYPEVLVISKGLTLEGTGRGHHDDRAVIIAPSGAPNIAIQVTATAAVTIRGLTVKYGGLNGIRGDGIVDLTVERVTVNAVNPPLGANFVISAVNNPPTAGPARLIVRESRVDGGTAFANSPTPAFAQTFGIRAVGVVDAVIERNTVRRAGGACINVQTELEGEVHVDILNNDLDECYPSGRAGSLTVGPRGTLPAPLVGFTATGTVNVVGNTIRNTLGSCLPTAGINYEAFSGRIEHNRVLGVVQECATATTRVLPAGIWVGSFRGATPANVTVRFNDIIGNAQAGLRVAANMTTPIDATCNYWGSASGPAASAWPLGTGDAVLVEAGGATPVFTPFANASNTGTRGRHDHDDDDDDDRNHPECGFGWSAPVSLGTAINTAANEQGPTLSEDGLSLYFGSDRLLGSGGFDIWVAERACRRCPWDAPVNLGSAVNGTGPETGPGLSADGHLLFFTSVRAGGQGGQDLYVSYRADPRDNSGWGAPVSVGSDVNTAAGEAGLEYLPAVGGDGPRIFFNRVPVGGASADIYVVPATTDGKASGPAVAVAELNDPVATDQGTTVRGDGRELVFFSTRPGGMGGNDLWTASRARVQDRWSTPQNLGTDVNSTAADQQPSLTSDGRTLIFASSRLGSLGGTDIWISTRSGHRSGDRHDRE